MKNSEALKLAKRFLETHDSLAFEELWSSTVNMARPYKYYDPYGARTTDDFLQITRIGLWEALLSFKEGKGCTLLTWIRMRMEQVLVKEVRKIASSNIGHKLSLDQPAYHTDDHAVTIEQQIYVQLAEHGYYPDAVEAWSEGLYWQIITAVANRISYNIPLSKCYGLKLAFPGMTRKSIAKVIGSSKPAVSQYFSIIREAISIAADQYAVRDKCPVPEKRKFAFPNT